MTDRNLKKKEDYARLIKAGFTPTEARRLRGASTAKIDRAVRTGLRPPVDPLKQAAGAGKTKASISPTAIEKYTRKIKTWTKARKKTAYLLPAGYTEVKGRIVYDQLHKDSAMKYLSNFSYVCAYQVKNEQTGESTWKFLTVTSHKKLSKKEIFQIAKEEMFESLENLILYETIPIFSSLKLVGAYERGPGVKYDYAKST